MRTSALTCAVMPRPRTAALVDGRVSVDGINFTDSMPSREHHPKIQDKTLAAGEMSTSGLVRLHAAGAPFVALPVFLKRGFSHRHVVTREDAPFTSPAELVGRRVGLDSWSSSLMVWIRGLFLDGYGVDQVAVRWVLAGDMPTNERDPAIERMPDSGPHVDRGWAGRELIDGVERPLRQSEKNLLALLVSGDLDAVLCTTIPHGPKLRCLFADPLEPTLVNWYRDAGIYPINHTLVAQSEVLAQRDGLAADLVGAFREARGKSGEPTPTLVAETAVIGHDPFDCTYGPAERRTLQRFIDYHVVQGLIDNSFDADELFWSGGEAEPRLP